MAYSRWSNSRWYTFWACGESLEYKIPLQVIKDNQVFEICDIPGYSITYAQIKRECIFNILMCVKNFYSEQHSVPILTKTDCGEFIYEETVIGQEAISFKELHELRTYIERFVEDVDEYFKPYNFFVYEWYYPIRSTVCNFFLNFKNKVF